MNWRLCAGVILGWMAGDLIARYWPDFSIRVVLALGVMLVIYALTPLLEWIVDGAPIRLPWR